METSGCLGSTMCVVAVLLECLLLCSVGYAEKDFTFEFLDTKNILKLHCDGDCTGENSLVNIIISDARSHDKMVVLSAKITTAYKLSGQDFTYYVRQKFSEESTPCYLELVIINFNLETPLDLLCNTTSSNPNGALHTRSSALTVVRGDSQDGVYSLSTSTVIILIVVIIVLFMLAVFFFSIWVRGCRRYRNKLMYQTPSQAEINHNQVFCGDGSSLSSYQKSPSKLSVRRDSEFKFPPVNGSVRRMVSRSESQISNQRLGHPPLPPAPPPKQLWRDRYNNGQGPSASSTIKVNYSYTVPQDAIEPDFSEDGDVTSGNNESQPTYTHRVTKQNAAFYSCVPVHSVDV